MLSVAPYGRSVRLIEVGGKASALRLRHGIYLDVVAVASAPVGYQSMLTPLYPGSWNLLRLFALEAHDLALTKLERNFERDRAGVEHLARSGYLKAPTLRNVTSRRCGPTSLAASHGMIKRYRSGLKRSLSSKPVDSPVGRQGAVVRSQSDSLELTFEASMRPILQVCSVGIPAFRLLSCHGLAPAGVV